MKTLRKYFLRYRYLFLYTTLLSLIILLPYIVTNKQFVIGWDMRTQYSSFYEELKTMLKQIPFYSFNYFLGNNFFASKLFYYHDIFDYIFTLFTKLNYYSVVIIQTYIKLLIASFCFYEYARYNKHKETSCLISALCFAFSSFLLEEIKDPFFLSFTIFIPLYFLTIDKYIRENKKVGFILISTFLLITNYYLFYSLSIFTTIYFIYKYYSINNSFKNIFKSILNICIYYTISILISGFASVPQFFNIIQNPRVGSKSVLLFYDSIIPYINILISWFTPTHIFVNRQTEISKLFYFVTKNNSVLALYLFASSIFSLILPQVIFNLKKENKILYSIITLLILFPFGASLMHGFSEPSFRFVQVILFMNISLSIKFLDDLTLINKKILKNTLLFILISSITFYTYSILKLNMKLTHEFIFIIIFLIFILINYYLIIKNKFKAIMYLTILELSISCFSSFYLNPYYRQFDKNTINSVSHTLLNKNDLNNYLLSIDKNNEHQFYRIFVDKSSVYWDYSTNLNLNYNFKGVMTYDSTVAYSISEMNDIIDIKSYLPWSYEIEDYNLLNLLSVKYAVTNDKVPFKKYHKVGEFNYFSVYENDEYFNFGKTYTYMSDKKDINLINSHIISSKDEIKKYIGKEVKTIDNVIIKNNYIYANIVTNSNGFLIVSLPYDKGWKISVNNKKVETFKVNGGLLAFNVDSGLNEIHMNFIPYGLSLGIKLSILGSILFMFVLVNNYKKKT